MLQLYSAEDLQSADTDRINDKGNGEVLGVRDNMDRLRCLGELMWRCPRLCSNAVDRQLGYNL